MTAEKHGLDRAVANSILESSKQDHLRSKQITEVREQLDAELREELFRAAMDLSQQPAIIPFKMIQDRAQLLHSTIEKLESHWGLFAVTTEMSLHQLGKRINVVIEAALKCEQVGRREDWLDLGAWYKDLETDTSGLAASIAWIDKLSGSQLPSPVLARLCRMQADSNCATLATQLKGIEGLRRTWDYKRSSLTEYGKLEVDWLSLLNAEKQINQGGLLKQLCEKIEELPAWSAFCRMLVECKANADLHGFVDKALDGSLETKRLAESYQLTIYEKIVEAAVVNSPTLKKFSRQKIEKIRESFRTLDVELCKLNRQEIAYQTALHQPPVGNSRGRVAEKTEMSLIRHEIGKQRAHCRIRDLLFRAGEAVQVLKPCFMMSPLSVAQYLDPEGLEFDIVIMDEASQIKPEDALGTVLRAKQLVVVGDPKQLPPTTFFDRISDDTDDDEATQFDNTESILEVAMKSFQPVRRLRWHYRSQHESLIQFSNHRFYDDDLIIFPSATLDSSRLGVYHQYIEKCEFQRREEHRRSQGHCRSHHRACPEQS